MYLSLVLSPLLLTTQWVAQTFSSWNLCQSNSNSHQISFLKKVMIKWYTGWVCSFRQCITQMSNSNFSHQVSTKESDIGIGQSVFGSYHDEVDYLDYMYERQIVMLSGKPRPIVTYDTIIHPFDVHTWVFTSIFMIVEFALLIVMQITWSKVSRKPLSSSIWIWISIEIHLKHNKIPQLPACQWPVSFYNSKTLLSIDLLFAKKVLPDILQLHILWYALENQQSTVYVVNWHFSKCPDRC